MRRNRRAIQRWITNLRSRSFLQGTGWLHFHDSTGHDYYCCLGVACATSTKTKRDTHQEEDDDRVYFGYRFVDDEVELVTFSDAMRLHYGLTRKEVDWLIDANDDGATFRQIAAELSRWLDIPPHLDREIIPWTAACD